MVKCALDIQWTVREFQTSTASSYPWSVLQHKVYSFQYPAIIKEKKHTAFS